MVARKRGQDVESRLRWTYTHADVDAGTLQPLIDALTQAGFSEIVLPEMDAENDAGQFQVWFSDLRVHTVESLAVRNDEVAELARTHGARLEHQSVEALEAAR
jgi:hypothetical protein